MKALVTGATGLLGSHIVDRLLARGDEVRALARPSSEVSYLQQRGVPIAQGDVTDPESLRRAAEGMDVVYHAAAMVSDWGPWPAFEATTIRGTENALAAALAAGAPRFLHVSTDSVYPTRPKLRGATLYEDGPLEERPPSWDHYQRSKLAAERIAWDYHTRGPIQVSAVRPALILGERDRSIMPELMSYLRGGGAVYVGRPDNRWHCVYAGDAAEACILAATEEKAVGQVYNLAAEVLTQREVFTTVAEAIGARPPRRSVPFWLVFFYGAVSETLARLSNRTRRPTMTRFSAATLAQDYVLDMGKLEALGWQAKVPLREAIRRSVEWVEARHSQPAGR
ncbi:MAG: NAD-dependent epimerase/dehydratase family protein [Chloroflexi bacterium]|nr:NAD-dependent epimerase/dehydratase family protein [Chloroflexota bacterium]